MPRRRSNSTSPTLDSVLCVHHGPACGLGGEGWQGAENPWFALGVRIRALKLAHGLPVDPQPPADVHRAMGQTEARAYRKRIALVVAEAKERAEQARASILAAT